MLRLFFFVMMYLTDYRAADVLRSGLTLGLVNAAAVGGWLTIRVWRMKRAAR